MYNNFSALLGKKLLKISDVHKNTGISKTTLADIYYQRAKDYKYSTLTKICEFLEVSIDDFVKKEGE